MVTPERKFDAGTGYRYGFNGKENDKDIGEGSQDYGMRIYDSRLGRFLSTDPLTNNYPSLTPYQFAGNNPIKFIDMDGEEPALTKIDYVAKFQLTNLILGNIGNEIDSYRALLQVVDSKEVKAEIIEHIRTLQGSYAVGITWMYKHRGNQKRDEMKRLGKACEFGIVITSGVTVGITTAVAMGTSAEAAIVAFEEGGVLGGLTNLGVEMLEYKLAELSGMPIPIRWKISTKAFDMPDMGPALNNLRGQIVAWSKQGFTSVNQILRQTTKTIKNLNKTIDAHIEKIANPSKFIKDWSTKSAAEKNIIINKWKQDIQRNTESKEVLKEFKNMLENLKKN